MALLSVLDPQARLKVIGGALHIAQNRQLRGVPLHQVSAVQLWAGASLSGAARTLLLKAGIPVVFLDRAGRCQGRISGPLHRAGHRRLGQVMGVLDAPTRRQVAVAVVEAKIANQRAVLAGRQSHLQVDALWGPLAELASMRLRVSSVESLEALRGMEGYAARTYFAGFSHALTAPGFSFNGRSRRPPRSPVNAALSFAYTLLTERCIGAVEVAGLDPYVGVLHEATRGQPALALDLAEPFRPLIDRTVLTLFNRRQLSQADFRSPTAAELGNRLTPVGAPEAVYLSDSGRETMIRAWDALLKARLPDPVSERRWPMVELLPRQAMHLGQVLCERLNDVKLFSL